MNIKLRNMRLALWLRLHLLFPLFPMLSANTKDKSGAMRRVDLAKALIHLLSGSSIFGESGIHDDLGLAGSVLSMFELLVSFRRPLNAAMRSSLCPDLHSFGLKRSSSDPGQANSGNTVLALDSSSVALIKAEVITTSPLLSPEAEAKLTQALDFQLEQTPQVGAPSAASTNSNEMDWELLVSNSTDPWMLVEEYSSPHDLPPWFLKGSWRRRRQESVFSTLE